jgi:hypothetical protein
MIREDKRRARRAEKRRGRIGEGRRRDRREDTMRQHL